MPARMAAKRHRDIHLRQLERSLSFRRKVQQLHLFAAYRVIDVLIWRSCLIVMVVKIRRQKWEGVIEPILIIGAGPFYPRLPSAAQWAKCHRPILTFRISYLTSGLF